MHNAQAVRDGWISFLSRYQWDWFATFTFKTLVHPEAADKAFRYQASKINRKIFGPRWYKKGQGIYWVRALELQRRGVIHFHALMSGSENLNHQIRRLDVMDDWWHLQGMARIEEPGSLNAVTRYCSKYVIKGGELDCSPNLKDYWRNSQLIG